MAAPAPALTGSPGRKKSEPGRYPHEGLALCQPWRPGQSSYSPQMHSLCVGNQNQEVFPVSTSIGTFPSTWGPGTDWLKSPFSDSDPFLSGLHPIWPSLPLCIIALTQIIFFLLPPKSKTNYPTSCSNSVREPSFWHLSLSSESQVSIPVFSLSCVSPVISPGLVRAGTWRPDIPRRHPGRFIFEEEGGTVKMSLEHCRVDPQKA